MICPLGHALEAFQTSAEGWSCSVCARVLEKNNTLYGCRPCDFDVCDQCSSHDFDGCWLTSAGQAVVISGPCIKGSLSLFRSEGDGQCSMEIQGTRYFGQLRSKGRIEWDDGDIWICETQGPRAAGAAATDPSDMGILSEPRQPAIIAATSSETDARTPVAPPPAPGRPVALPSAPRAPRTPPAYEVSPPPMPAPILREQHEVAPQWAVDVDDEVRPPANAAGSCGVSLPPPPMECGDPNAKDRV